MTHAMKPGIHCSYPSAYGPRGVLMPAHSLLHELRAFPVAATLEHELRGEVYEVLLLAAAAAAATATARLQLLQPCQPRGILPLQVGHHRVAAIEPPLAGFSTSEHTDARQDALACANLAADIIELLDADSLGAEGHA
ncbi:hypothetical protein WOLCODRAFT_157957 [Wolfiporia cocos MD-104 SS10]|uniref:Uncharacterized protein n=1 Tax=Wolfiporia cocos (strain MD-104) TaxID=742152 RepID=A0A2H3J4S3_WOLCO|nr:hypothetical protein WOLCODRAFT_157957 [Wolfiporia cocos MD-104 SS10]